MYKCMAQVRYDREKQVVSRRGCPDSAKAVLHELHINDRIDGTADSKLFPVLRDGTMKWAVLVDHLAPTK